MSLPHSLLHFFFAFFPSSSCSPAIFHMEEQGMGLCAAGPHALCQRWLLSLFPQPHSSYETLRSPLSTLRFKEKIDIKRVCLGGTYRPHKREEYRVEWLCISSCLEPQHQNAGGDAQKHPALQSHANLAAPRRAGSDTHSHTCTLADNYPNSLWRAERPWGPHNRFRQGPWHTQEPPSLSISQAICLFCLTHWTWSVYLHQIVHPGGVEKW